MNQKTDWNEAKRLCRLSDEEVRMAQELGLQPKSLIKNRPAPSQPWKEPVNMWVRSLWEQKIGSRQQQAPAPSPKVVEFRDPSNPWPDKPEIPPLKPYNPNEDPFGEEEEDWFEPPTYEDVDEEGFRMLRRQRLFRWVAQSVAIAMSQLPEVQKVAAFGGAAETLRMEVPRFRKYRRHRIEILHESGDLDLAVWLTDLSRLKELKKALNQGLKTMQNTPYGGVANHQVDVHIFEAETGEYRGRLCIYSECPKLGKRDCFVPRCGEEKFLQQFNDYHFNPRRFEAALKVVLFDRDTGFLVRPPRIDAPPPRSIPNRRPRTGVTDDDLPS